MLLLPHAEITVYVCISPNTPAELLAAGECRELVGGVRVSAYKHALARHSIGSAGSSGSGGDDSVQNVLMGDHTLKFWALYGQSILKTSTRYLKLGVTNVLGETYVV